MKSFFLKFEPLSKRLVKNKRYAQEVQKTQLDI